MAEPPIDSWADPVAAADAAATSLLRLIEGGEDVAAVVASLRRRTSEALILTLAEVIESGDPLQGVRRFRDDLRDWSWLNRLAVDHAGAASFGVLSIGTMTRRFLGAVVDVTTGVPEIHTHSRAVARGLGYLGLPILLGDVVSAERVIIPAQARHRDRVWTTTNAADAVQRAVRSGCTPVVLCHPAATLSSRNRLAYRPEPVIIDVKASSGVTR